MTDENGNGAAATGTTEVPAVGETTPPVATKEPEGAATKETAVDGSTTVAELKKIPFDKIDPTKLKGEALQIYKFWQGNFTKSTQEYKSKLDVANKQIEEFRPLLNDPDVQAKAYFHQFGRWPEGYAKAPLEVEEPQLKPEDIPDPFARKLYEDNLALKSRLDRIEGQNNETVNTTVEGAAQAVYDKLTPAQQEIWQTNFSEIKEVATSLIKADTSRAPVTEKVKKALTRAFNSAAGGSIDGITKKAVESAEKALLEKIKKKKDEPRPETGLNATNTVPQKMDTAEGAVMAAMNMIAAKNK